MIDQAILLSNLSNERLVLRGFRGLIHSFFPLIKTLLPCFDLLDIFLIGRVNGLLGFNPGNFQFSGLILLDRTFQLDPIYPKSGWCTVSIFSSVCMVLLNAGFKILWHSLLNTKLLGTVDRDIDNRFNHLWVPDCPGHLMNAQGRIRET